MTTSAGASDSEPMENKRGIGPATPVSAALSANEKRKEDGDQAFTLIKFNPAAPEVTRRDFLPAELMSTEEEDNPDVEIQLIFRRKIAGLRRLPRHQRAQALRAALEWLWSTLAALREKRAYAPQM